MVMESSEIKKGRGLCHDRFFQLMSNETIRKAAEEMRPLCIDFEITSRCAGSCRYCYSSSNEFQHITMEKEKVLDILDQAWELGVRHITWPGGDPLLHPHIFEILNYSGDKGLNNFLATSGLINRKAAKKLGELHRDKKLAMVGIHIDTINQEVYNKLHTNSKGLKKKMEGFKNLLDEGFPPENTVVCICLTKYSLETIEETLDWFLDKVEYPYWVDLIPFKLEGYGKEHFSYLEPGLSDIERSMRYRAKKVGEHWLRVGVMDMTQYFCRTYFYITYDGFVLPCGFFRDKPVGNVYDKPLDEIVEKNKDILFFNFKIKGRCGNCENNDVCFGCRANAYTYLGDPQASDPKCWMNPEAKEYYFT